MKKRLTRLLRYIFRNKFCLFTLEFKIMSYDQHSAKLMIHVAHVFSEFLLHLNGKNGSIIQ